MVSRAAALLATFLLACLPGTPPADGATPSRPSILLITLDTTRADHVGCYGAAFAATPNLDALAKAGTRFDMALSPVPLTLPAHASLLSGRVPRRHGVRDNALFRIEKDVPLLQEALGRAGYRTAAFVSAAVLDHGLGLDRGFAMYDDNVRIGERSAFNYEERAASQTNEAAIARLAELKAPFFLWVHYFDPHLPYVPPEPFRTRFKDRLYDGEIAFMDREVGRLIEAVRGAGGPLLIVVAGDHGESLGEHGEAAHGVFVYQATQRVPLILAGPDVPAGGVIRRTVGLVDLAPTLLDYLGLPPLAGADGRSLVPLLRGKAGGEPDYEMESWFARFAYGWPPLRALVRGPLKYIDARRPELYDLGADPSESSNVVRSREEAAAALTRTLRRLTEEDSPRPSPFSPEMAEQRRRLESLGYVGGTAPTEEDASIDPKDGIAWLADLDAARRAAQLGDPKDGIAPLERLLSRNPRNVLAMLTLAQCHLATGGPDKAIDLSRRAVEINPDNDVAHFNLANALAEKGRGDAKLLEEARSEYERALALDPRRADVYLTYASLLIRERKHEQARTLLARARQAGVRDPEVETETGLLELARKAPEPAAAAFERALVLNPRAAPALEGLGQVAYAKMDFPRAADYYARALESAPRASLAKTLGSIYLYKLDDKARARRAFRRALELSRPGDSEIEDLRLLVQELGPG